MCVLETHDHDVVLEIIVITFAVKRTNSQLGNSAKLYCHRSRTKKMHSNKSDKWCVCVCVLEAHDHDVVLEIIVITFAANRTNSQLIGDYAK